MSKVRFNPPAPLSLAAHFDAENKSKEEEHQRLAAINAQAKELGYNFEGRANTLELLRSIYSMAHASVNNPNGKNWEEKEPNKNDFYLLIHRVADQNNILATPSGEPTVMVERFQHPTA